MKLRIQELIKELMLKADDLATCGRLLDRGHDDMFDEMCTLASQIKKDADLLEDRIAAFKLYKEDAAS
jgi:hypothetical protein